MERRRSKRLEKSEPSSAPEYQRSTKRPRQTGGTRGGGSTSTTQSTGRTRFASRGRGRHHQQSSGKEEQQGVETGQVGQTRDTVSVRGGRSYARRAKGESNLRPADATMERQNKQQQQHQQGDGDKNEQPAEASGSGAPEADRGEMRRMAENSSLHGILKSFSRIDDLLGSGQHSGKKMRDIIEALNCQDMDRMRTATDELNNLLNNTAEDAYSSFPIEQIIPALVNCMSIEVDPETNVKAIRCLGTFARSLPSSCASMVRHGALPALCSRLMSGFEIIDVAEEAIRAFKYISQENPEACLDADGMCAVLCYLEFLSHHEQKDAVESAANMCKGLKAENSDKVMDQVQNLVNLLAYQDVQLVDRAILALLRICEAFANSPELLAKLSETQLITTSFQMISMPPSNPTSVQLKASTYFMIVRMLTICAAGWPPVAHDLLETNISDTIKNLLQGSTAVYKPGAAGEMVRTPENLKDVLSLADSMLPKVEQPEQEPMLLNHTMRIDFLAENPTMITKLGTDLLSLLLQVHSVTVSLPVRATILSIWSKVVHHIEAEAFREIIGGISVASFLSPLLTSPQDEIVLQAMVLVEALMTKLPDVFRTSLIKEGVVHAIDELSRSGPSRRSARLQEQRKAKEGDETPTNASPSISPEHQEAVSLARRLMETYFKGSIKKETEGTKWLRDLGKELTEGDDPTATITKILDALAGDEISVFEFLESKIVPSLKEFLVIEGKVHKSSASIDNALRNVKVLVEVGLVDRGNGEPALGGLLRKLKDAMEASEKFPVRHVIGRNIRHPGPASRTGSDDVRTQNLRLASLGQPLKLKLHRASGETDLKDINLSQVLVEPLVMIQTLEEYLWPKVNSTTPPVTDAGPSAREGDGNAEGDPNPGAGRGLGSNRYPGRGGGRRPGFRMPSSRLQSPGGEDSEAMSISQEDSEGDGEPEVPFDEDDDLIMDDMPEDDEDMDDDEGVVGEDEDVDEEQEDEPNVHVHNVELTSEAEEEMLEEEEPGPSHGSGVQSYAEVTRAGKQPKLEFWIGNIMLRPHETVFQAVREHIAKKVGFEEETEGKPDKVSIFKRDWEEPHSVTYRKKVELEAWPPEKARGGKKRSQNQKWISNKQAAALTLLQQVSIPEGLDIEDDLAAILHLMKLLESINRLAPRLLKNELVLKPMPRSELMSSKLTTKLAQLLKDPLTVCSKCVSPWCAPLVKACRFLFPFEQRRRFFYAELDPPHALQFFNKEFEASGEKKDSLKVERGDQGEVRLSKLRANKVRISRSKILPMAMKIMEMFARNNSDVIEVQYFNECGVGEGPTLEFFTLVSHEIQKLDLKMWRSEDVVSPEKEESDVVGEGVGDMGPGTKSADYVHAPQGLFPRPYPPNETPSSVIKYFKFLGRTVARALLDCRLMDLDLNPLFFKIMRGCPVDLFDLKIVDRSLGMTLEKLQSAADVAKANRGPVLIDGSPLEDMYIDFSLPGYPEYELRQINSEFVTKATLQAYIDTVVNATLVEGIEHQVSAFRVGFEEVLLLDSLDYFYDDEFDILLRGTQEKWTVEKLNECVSFSHGYTRQSEQAQWLLEVLAEFDGCKQRRFLQFLTGSPRLPPGGIGALSPKLTVVQRLSIGSEGDSANDLPSVATCVNFLKLPKYGGKEVMQKRLLVAINEGQFAFDLS
ncbi:hypothetical protein BSKO_07167 [Bryopsis sp. KO-2023]|nr:hypothetical protein BSKO_07167 [Bryopsis sp. KO-2023]